MPLDRVHRVSLAHSVGAQLCRAIVSGDIPAGTQLSEPALAARLGVSRAPIREAQG
jgi:DNA-binding GntR family transcriptional regulator